jgi:hypothetical protein
MLSVLLKTVLKTVLKGMSLMKPSNGKAYKAIVIIEWE